MKSHPSGLVSLVAFVLVTPSTYHLRLRSSITSKESPSPFHVLSPHLVFYSLYSSDHYSIWNHLDYVLTGLSVPSTSLQMSVLTAEFMCV